MGIVVFVTLLLALFTLKIRLKNGEIHEDYMNIDHTNAVKGIFVVFIVLDHFQQYVPETARLLDYPFIFVREYIAQLVVTPFLFVSGYGIIRSYEKKGRDYISSLPRRRILKTLLHFDLGVCLFLIANLLLKNAYSPREYLTALTGWNPVGNSNWYIFAVLCLYLVTYLAGLLIRLMKKEPSPLLLAIFATAGTFVYMLVISRFKQPIFYNTVLCYPAGMWFALWEEPLKKAGRRLPLWFTGASVLGVAFSLAFLLVPFHSVKAILFPFFIFFFTQRFTVNSRLLTWLGKHTFSIYMLQRLPMMILQKAGLDKVSVDLYLAAVLVCTGLLAWGFDFCMKRLDKKLAL